MWEYHKTKCVKNKIDKKTDYKNREKERNICNNKQGCSLSEKKEHKLKV